MYNYIIVILIVLHNGPRASTGNVSHIIITYHNVTTNVAPICQGSSHVQIHRALCCQLRIGQTLPISFEKAVLLAFDE